MVNWTVSTLLRRLLEVVADEYGVDKGEVLRNPRMLDDRPVPGMQGVQGEKFSITAADLIGRLRDRVVQETMQGYPANPKVSIKPKPRPVSKKDKPESEAVT